MESELITSTDTWNTIGHIHGSKCVACKRTANDAEILRCCKCRTVFHVVNCPQLLDKDILPCPSSLKIYIKFASKEFSSGDFHWTCFRCKGLASLSAKRNLEERVDLLEALLITLAPQMQAVNTEGRRNSPEEISQLVQSIRHSKESTVDPPPPSAETAADSNPSPPTNPAPPVSPANAATYANVAVMSERCWYKQS